MGTKLIEYTDGKYYFVKDGLFKESVLYKDILDYKKVNIRDYWENYNGK